MANYDGLGVDAETLGHDIITNEVPDTLPEEAPFQVGEEIEVGDISDVQAQLLPVAKDVVAEIRKAGVAYSNDKTLMSLKLELVLPEGVMVNNPETGELEASHVGKVIFPGFMDLCFWASNDGPQSLLDRLKVGPRPDPKGWYRSRQHLLGFKEFAAAVGWDLKKVRINDEACASLIGQRVLVSIRHEAETVKGPDGKREKTGVMREKFQGWKRYQE